MMRTIKNCRTIHCFCTADQACKKNCSPCWLVAWLSGRTSIFGRRTFPVLRETCSWWVTTYMGKPSSIGQPTRPTQPFIPRGRQMSTKLQLDVSCLSQRWRHLVNAYKGKAGMVYLQIKLCDPCLSALRYT